MKIQYVLCIVFIGFGLHAAHNDSNKRKRASSDTVASQKKQKIQSAASAMHIDDENKKKSEEIISELAKAIAAHRNNDVRKIVQEQKDTIDLSAAGNIAYSNDITLPIWAIMKDNEIALNILLDAGVNSNVQTMQGQTALMVAAERGMDTMVRALLAHGARADLQDALGNTALNLLAFEADISTDDTQRRQQNIIALLSEHASLDHYNNLGDTPLVIAVRRGQPYLVRLLIKAGANPRQTHPRNHTTIYDMIAFKDSDDQIRRVHKARLAQAIKEGVDEYTQYRNNIVGLLEPYSVPYVDVIMADYVGSPSEPFQEEEKKESAAWHTYH